MLLVLRLSILTVLRTRKYFYTKSFLSVLRTSKNALRKALYFPLFKFENKNTFED